jgi:hypothetical protein
MFPSTAFSGLYCNPLNVEDDRIATAPRTRAGVPDRGTAM